MSKELANQRQGSQKLLMKNKTKHRIRTGLQINKDFSNALEKAITDEKYNRIDQLELFEFIKEINQSLMIMKLISSRKIFKINPKK